MPPLSIAAAAESVLLFATVFVKKGEPGARLAAPCSVRARFLDEGAAPLLKGVQAGSARTTCLRSSSPPYPYSLSHSASATCSIDIARLQGSRSHTLSALSKPNPA
jgi:hypothetical protein